MLKSIVALLLGIATVSYGRDISLKEMTAEQLLELPEAVIEGMRRHRQVTSELIVGGTEVNPEYKYPFTADLFYKGVSGGHFCGGSLINSTWILTAAHCSTGITPRTVSVQVHRHDLTRTAAAENAEVRDVVSIVIHPAYNRLTTNNDVALWELASPILTVPTVALDTDGSFSRDGVVSTVVGWGAIREGGRGSDVLLEVDVPIISNTKCNTQYGGDITASMICAGYDQGGKDACQGDSGGPLFVNKNAKPVQIGVVSWGEGCARAGKAGVYARVSYLYDFIADTVSKKFI